MTVGVRLQDSTDLTEIDVLRHHVVVVVRLLAGVLGLQYADAGAATVRTALAK